jgi:hypothetical protein
MSYTYFPDLNRLFKDLYWYNQDWFKFRDVLTEHEEKILFHAFLDMGDALRVVRDVFVKRKNRAHQEAKTQQLNPLQG